MIPLRVLSRYGLPVLIGTVAFLLGCKKNEETPKSNEPSDMVGTILNDFSYKVGFANYLQMEREAQLLHVSLQELSQNQDASRLQKAQEAWKAVRTSWEQAEGFLFGPVSTEALDPSIDDWPVNRNDFDSLLAAPNVRFTQPFLDSLQTTLRGFHAIEYILWGEKGGRIPAELNPRMLDYATAVALNISLISTKLRESWDTQKGNYIQHLLHAGKSGSLYLTRRAALIELVDGMAGICGEVSEGKLSEPYLARAPRLEESQFSQNSITDFTNNILGAENVYLCRFNGQQGTGLSDLVAKNNKDLDVRLKQQFASAKASLSNITDPFGTAITSQPVQIQQAITTIGILQKTLEEELEPYLMTIVKD